MIMLLERDYSILARRIIEKIKMKNRYIFCNDLTLVH